MKKKTESKRNKAVKETPLQKARRQLSQAGKDYKAGKGTLNDIQAAASKLAAVKCKINSK